MNEIEYLHEIQRMALRKMKNGAAVYGMFDPFSDKRNLAENGKEETADCYNYALMEKQKLLANLNSPAEDLETLLKLLDDIASGALLQGVRWCQYEELLHTKGEQNHIDPKNIDTNKE